MQKMSYQLYSIRHPNEAEPSMFPPGLFSWVTAFEKYGKHGTMDANISKEHLEESDIIHVNVTPTNISYLSAIREALGDDSPTKIVANVDFGILMWNQIDPFILRDQLRKADTIFHVESIGAKRLERLIGRKVHVLPHPVNVEEIKMGAKTGEDRERSPVIACQYHRYGDTWCEYFYGLQRIREEYDINIVLMNYTAPRQGPKVPCICMFTELLQQMVYPDYIEMLSRVLINVDMTYDYTYGRGVVDAAALKVPTIGSKTIEAQRILWPELAVTPGNDEELEKTVREILDNESFREEMAQLGYEKCEMYSLKNSYEKMVNIIREGDVAE